MSGPSLDLGTYEDEAPAAAAVVEKSPSDMLAEVQAKLTKPTLDDMIYFSADAAQRIDDRQVRFVDYGWNKTINAGEVARAAALRAASRLLELAKYSDQKELRRLLEDGRKRMQAEARHNTELAMHAHEAKGGIL